MEKAAFLFRTNCQACGEVTDFVAAFATAIRDEVFLVVQCEECGIYQIFTLDREDFLDLFGGGH